VTATPNGRLPTFLVIGAMKSGTSSLRDYLGAHPDVYVPPEEELHFFTGSHNWSKGVGWYRAHFEAAGDVTAVGEKSPTYSMHPEFPGVPKRIAGIVPDVRLLYIVRHPLQRITSHFVHQFGRGHEHQPINRAVRGDCRYVDTTRYAMQLDRYLDWFPAEQIMVVTADQLDHDRVATFRRIASFCGVDPDVELDALGTRQHESSEKQVPVGITAKLRSVPAVRRVAESLPAPLRARLGAATRRSLKPEELRLDASTEAWIVDQLQPDLAGLRRWLGDDFDGWGYI
jgi:hypothetical protein